MPLPRRRPLGPVAVATLAAAALATGCAAEDVGSLGVSVVRPAPTSAPPPGSAPDRVDPFADPRGLHPSLTAVPEAGLPRARALVARVATKASRGLRGYEREERFGPAWTDDVDVAWGHDGCRTREQILQRDLRAITFRAGTDDCVVLDGILLEPYTGRTIEFSKSRPEEVQIDHVVPLAYAWSQGAGGWTQDRRRALANDPLNLLAVDGPANQRKSDSGPAGWMPDNRAVRCAYAVRFGQVAIRYGLPVTTPDRSEMRAACG